MTTIDTTSQTETKSPNAQEIKPLSAYAKVLAKFSKVAGKVFWHHTEEIGKSDISSFKGNL